MFAPVTNILIVMKLNDTNNSLAGDVICTVSVKTHAA